MVDGLVSTGNIGSGIWFDMANQNATIRNCLVNQNGDGIHYEISYGGQIYNNLVSNSRFSRDAVGFNPTTLNPYSPSSQGIYLSSSAYCKVYNNTVANNDNGGIVSCGPVRGDQSANNYNVYSYGSDLRNNISAMNAAYHDPASGAGNFFEYCISNAGGNTNTTGVANLSPSASPWKESTSDYNLFQVRDNFDSWTCTTFSSWQSGMCQDCALAGDRPEVYEPRGRQFHAPARQSGYRHRHDGPRLDRDERDNGGQLRHPGQPPGDDLNDLQRRQRVDVDRGHSASGSGGLTETGGGLLILSGANTYQGPTTISGGTLQLAGGFDRLPTTSALMMASGTALDLNGNAQTIGSISGSGAVLDSSALTVGTDSTDTTFSGTLSGSGDLLKTGVGTLTLAGSNSYSGKTYINAGILQIGNYGGCGTLGTGDVLDNATLMFSRSGAVTVANNVSGNGSLIQAGLGTLVLTGTNTYSGGTYIDGGTLQLAGGPNRLPVGTAVTLRTGVLDLNGNDQAIGSLNYVGGGSGGGSSAVTLGVATLSIGDGTNSNYAWNISGSGSLAKTGSGMLTLTGSSTYTGGTTVSEGTLQIGDGSSGHDGSLATCGVTDNAVVVYDVFAGQTADYPISGGGSLTKIGGGALILSGTDSYSGETTVSAGTLELLSSSALPTETRLTVAAGATLIFNPATVEAAPLAGDVHAAPEPGTLALLGAAAIGLLGCAWRRRKCTIRVNDARRACRPRSGSR